MTRKKKEIATMEMPGTIGSAKIVLPAEPKIIRGSHSTRTEHPDGRVEFVTHWDELVRDVQQALLKYESTILENIEDTPKKTRKKKV